MRFSVRKLTLMAALTAIALIVFIVEAQIPLPFHIPGVKLGLANAVTLFALFVGQGDGSGVPKFSGAGHENRTPVLPPIPSLRISDAFMILICRIILGAAFTGRFVAFIYSLAGGLLGFIAQALVKRIVTNKQIWVCGAVGAVFHNIGQIAAAMLITGTPAIAAYLPLLIVAGVFTGVVTGLAAQFTLARVLPNG